MPKIMLVARHLTGNQETRVRFAAEHIFTHFLCCIDFCSHPTRLIIYIYIYIYRESQLSRSLEPTTYHPQEDHKWIHSPSWGEIERKLKETHTGQLLGKTVIALRGIWTHVPLITSRVWWPLHYQDNHAGNMADWSLSVWHLRGTP